MPTAHFIHERPPTHCAAPTRAQRASATKRASVGAATCAIAPENNTIKPCSVNTMSRLKPWISNANSEPPWYSAPNNSDASTMPTGWLRPINDTAMPAKPAPTT